MLWLTTFCRRIVLFLFTFALVLGLLFYLASTTTPMPQQSISGKDVATSHKLLVTTVQHLRQAPGGIALEFDQHQLDSLLKVAGYAAGPIQFVGHISNFGMALHIDIDASVLWPGRSVRLSCLFLPGDAGFAIFHCQLGRLPIPTYFVYTAIRTWLDYTFIAPSGEQLLALFAKGHLADGKLYFVDSSASAITLQFKPLFYRVTRRVLGVTLEQTAMAPDVKFYLQQLQQLCQQHPEQRNLAFYLQQLLLIAGQRALNADEQLLQFRSALWALITGFGAPGFISLVAPDMSTEQVPLLPKVLLADRADLSLHFLYSAALKMLSSREFAEQAGYLKEILDTEPGGSGFSFTDIVANQAGTLLAQRLADIDLLQVTLLNVRDFEASFMPELTDLTDGLSTPDLHQTLSGIDNEQIKIMQQIINTRLSQLTLYQHTN